MSRPKKDSRPSEGFHQEYIVSLRYRNDLPPPEMPPKLLDIPHEGLEGFLTPGFASNLVRREEPNIDVDAEGGMPIDLVGIPGLHLGDESGTYDSCNNDGCSADILPAILAPENPPPADPADAQLLIPLEQLKNPFIKNANVSFLRRTQYITAARGTEGVRVTPTSVKSRRLNDKSKISNEDPIYIKKHIIKGFDIAYPESRHTGEDTAERIKGHTPTKAETDAWANPVHPDNPKLKPVGFFPVLPDLQGFPDPGGFVQFKFDKIPIPAVSGKRDERMDVAILYPSAPEERICQEHAAKVALHKANPNLYLDPGAIPWDYDLFLPESNSPASTQKIKHSLDMSNPDRDDQDNYTHDDGESRFHRYDRVRTYATSSQTLNRDQKQRDIALTLYDPAEDTMASARSGVQKAAYYYPIISKTRLKPERTRKIAKAGLAPSLSQSTREDQADQIHLRVRDPDEAEVYKRALHRAAVDPEYSKEMPPAPQESVNEEAEAEAEPSSQQGIKGEQSNEEQQLEDRGKEDRTEDSGEKEASEAEI